jgi:hypothetical protein
MMHGSTKLKNALPIYTGISNAAVGNTYSGTAFEILV